MSSLAWPLLFVFTLWKLGIFALDKLFQANKLGGIEDPMRWWHWIIIILAYAGLELLLQILVNSISSE